MMDYEEVLARLELARFERYALEPSPMIEQDEACSLLKCSILTLHNMLASGSLPGIIPGKQWVIPRDAFIEAVNALAVREQKARMRAEQPILQPEPEKKKRGRPRSNPLLVRSSQPGWHERYGEKNKDEPTLTANGIEKPNAI